MSKIDYTNEYRNLLDSFTTKNKDTITKAANAMGLNYNVDPLMILLQLNEKYNVTGISAETSICSLKEEYASF